MIKLIMKKTISSVKDITTKKYLLDDKDYIRSKSTNINILLNRVKLDQKRENRKKIIFSLIASLSVLMFGYLIV